MKITNIYDNQGKTADRYTIYTDNPFDHTGHLMSCLYLSGSPTHPCGVSMWSCGVPGEHNGEEIQLTDLPNHLQAHIKERVEE